MGRSRGGLTTKIHTLVDAKGLPFRFLLTPGQSHDATAAQILLQELWPDSFVLADKAYDADWIRACIEAQEAVPIIPDRSNRNESHAFSPLLYRLRNQIERFFNKIKHFRRIATRYEKLAANYLAMSHPTRKTSCHATLTTAAITSPFTSMTFMLRWRIYTITTSPYAANRN